MARAAVYVESSIVSYLVGRLNERDLLVAANQELTRQWWSKRRSSFELFASAAVLDEVMKGDSALAAERLRVASELNLVEVTAEARDLAQELLRRSPLPPKADVDALHIAIAAVHGMDYLLTWNCKHIANAVTLPAVYDVCRDVGYEPPFVCTPQELMEG